MRRRNDALRRRVHQLHAGGTSVRRIAWKVRRSPTRVWAILQDHHKEKS